MARISTYSQDPNLEGQDRVIGSDVSNANATMNFSLDSLGEFYARSGVADATRLGFRFRILQNDPGTSIRSTTGYIDNKDLSMLSNLWVSTTTTDGFDFGVLESIINGSVIKIASLRRTADENQPAQGFFNVTMFDSISNGTNIVGYRVQLTPVSDGTGETAASYEGAFRLNELDGENDTDFVIVPFGAGSGGGGGTGELNQNAFGFVNVNGVTLEADAAQDTLNLIAGTNITLTPSESTDSVTISALGRTNSEINTLIDNRVTDTFVEGLSVDYASLSNLPTLFDGNYNSLTNLPTLFNGDYNSLTNLPTLLTLGTTSTTALAGDTDVENVDINQYTTITAAEDGDFILIQDTSDSDSVKKISRSNFLAGLSPTPTTETRTFVLSFRGGSRVPGDAGVHNHAVSASGFTFTTGPTYSLSAQSDPTIAIDSSGVVTVPASVNSGSYTVQAQGAYEQTDLNTNTGTFDESHSVTIFSPYYFGTHTGTDSGVANSTLEKSNTELTSAGGTHVFTNTTAEQHYVLNLPFTATNFTVNGFPTTPFNHAALTAGYETYIFTSSGGTLTIRIN